MANLKVSILCLYLLVSFCAIAEGRNLTKKSPSRNVFSAESYNVKRIKKSSPNLFRTVKIFIKRLLGIRWVIIDYNTIPFIDTVTLNRTHIIIGCLSKISSQNFCSENDQKVEVTVHATDADGDSLIYNYQVIVGEIIGSGNRVIWDLSNVPPGKYGIKIYADDGCGICGKPAVMEIRVVECEECSR